MLTFRLWKQWKKRLRRKRSPLWTLSSILLWICLSGLVYTINTEAVEARKTFIDTSHQPTLNQLLEEQEAPIVVTLHRLFVCGEEIEALGNLLAADIVQLIHEHPEWSAMVDTDDKSVRLVEQVDDLSSHCKSHAYFGVDKDGNFSLFDGQPRNDKVMRTFFQLDVQYMESSLPQDKLDQLTQGIPVSDMDEYNSVLSTFSDFATGKNDGSNHLQAY